MTDPFLALGIFFNNHPFVLVAFIVWSTAWKGVALWKAGRLSQKKWFIVLLVVNLAGLLEIVYIFFVARKKEKSSQEPHPPGL